MTEQDRYTLVREFRDAVEALSRYHLVGVGNQREIIEELRRAQEALLETLRHRHQPNDQ